jgi:hypothetical protein
MPRLVVRRHEETVASHNLPHTRRSPQGKGCKEWFLNNQNRPGVQDPTLPDARLPISAAVDLYVDSPTRCKRTKSAYGHAVREFEAWNSSLKNRGKKTFVEEIDKAHLGVSVAHRLLRGGAITSAFFSQLSQRQRSDGNLSSARFCSPW